MQPFVEQRLPLPLIPEFRASLEFNTSILEDGSGREQRIPSLTEYQLKADLSNLVLTEIEANNILNFFKARRGKYEGFRFKFWADCWVTHLPEYYDATNTVYSQGIAANVSGFTQYQLLKVYAVDTVRGFKTIRKPLSEGLEIYVNSVEQFGNYTLDTSTGIITFNTPLSASDSVTWSGEFELAVRFEQDSMPRLLEVGEDLGTTIASEFSKVIKYYRFDSLPIVELIEGRLAVETPSDFLEITKDLNLGYLPQPTETTEFETLDLELSNGVIHRQTRQDNKSTYELSEVILEAKRAKYLIAFFVACKGRAISFPYRNFNNELTRSRFDTDTLEISPVVREDGEFVLNFGSLKLTNPTDALGSIFSTVDSETYIIAYLDTSGSMDAQLSTVENAVDQLRTIFKDKVYGGDEAKTAKYFKGWTYEHNERWLEWMGREIRDNPATEPNKVVILAYLNESTGVYYFDDPSINETFQTDLNNFLSSYTSREIFAGFVFAIQHDNPEYLIFKEHLTDAISGQNSYPTTLKDYGIKGFLDINPATTAEQYVNIMINGGIGINSVSNAPKQNYTRCIKIARADGLTLGFTTHDKSLSIAGTIYRAREAVNPTAIEEKFDLSVNNSEIESVLSSNAITDADIIAGKYEDAEITIALVDFANLPANLEEAYILQKGLVGETSSTDFSYTFEVLSKAAALLNRKASKKMSPICPYQLGDLDCGVNMSAYTYSVAIQSVSNSSTFTINGGVGDGLLKYGIATFTSGLNAGLEGFILEYSGGTVKLFTGMPYAIFAGDTLTVSQGCAKTPTACRGYNNYLRFGGFPTEGNFMPGNDFLLNPLG